MLNKNFVYVLMLFWKKARDTKHGNLLLGGIHKTHYIK